MISRLTGTVIHKDARCVVLDVSGVGYKVTLTKDILAEITTKLEGVLTLWTYLAVREDALDLYGFLKKDDLDFFELLIAHVSGVGPKTAMGIMGATTVDTLKRAIASGETAHLTKISGIGKKVAEKIVLELKEKIGNVEEYTSTSMRDDSDTLEALKTLGYGERDIRDALKKLPKTISGTSDKVKHALKLLGK